MSSQQSPLQNNETLATHNQNQINLQPHQQNQDMQNQDQAINTQTQPTQPPPLTLQLFPQTPIRLTQQNPIPQSLNGLLTQAERQLLLNGLKYQHFPPGQNLFSRSMLNQRTPARLITFLFQGPLLPSIPTEPPMNQLIQVNQTEHIFQAFHIDPHVFVSSSTTNRIHMAIGHERNVLIIGREF